jgi:hypothetical protein
MRIYALTWRTAINRLALFVVLTIGLFALIVQGPAKAAPLEEDIPSSGHSCCL